VTGLFAAAPALPLHTAGPYVAAAYVVFVALILIYVAIMARKQMRTERELRELRRQLAERDPRTPVYETEPTPSPPHRTPSQERVA
jgi:CcmD family protein